MHYKNHLESVYCIDAAGSAEDCATGEIHRIRPSWSTRSTSAIGTSFVPTRTSP
nr:ectoine synthase [Mesorhizobium norvegicum]